jgi:hypothetical protein
VSVYSIDVGRKGFAISGKEHEGRISYEDGISNALTAFQEAQITTDPEIIILSEYTFLSQELQFCDQADTDTHSSLTQALQGFDDALLSLEAVSDMGYKVADKTYPHDSKYRIKGVPKDAFHTACISHQTRLHNFLRTPGIDMIEKSLLKQRITNIQVAQRSYIEKQKKALA